MSDISDLKIYRCDECDSPCILMVADGDIPETCPFSKVICTQVDFKTLS